MKVYLLQEAIDLGYHTQGVYSTKEKAEEAYSKYREMFKAKHKFELIEQYLEIEEFELDTAPEV
jgi:hypothetical protein